VLELLGDEAMLTRKLSRPVARWSSVPMVVQRRCRDGAKRRGFLGFESAAKVRDKMQGGFGIVR
jgi:hypothetical protein